MESALGRAGGGRGWLAHVAVTLGETVRTDLRGALWVCRQAGDDRDLGVRRRGLGYCLSAKGRKGEDSSRRPAFLPGQRVRLGSRSRPESGRWRQLWKALEAGGEGLTCYLW